MAALHPTNPPPRTPSPKIRIHRSQSFTSSPSSRISVTPIDDSPYSKSASAIIVAAKPLPQYDALKAAERGRIMLHTKMSEDSIMSDTSSMSSTQSSPLSPSSTYALFSSDSPPLLHRDDDEEIESPNPLAPPEVSAQVMNSSVQLLQYQDEPDTPMFDPWLVRVVLDLYDVRGFDWTMIAEPIERVWGFRTCSAEVMGILSANGRLSRCWWD